MTKRVAVGGDNLVGPSFSLKPSGGLRHVKDSRYRPGQIQVRDLLAQDRNERNRVPMSTDRRYLLTVLKVKPTESKKARPTTATSPAPAIIHCFSSTSSVIWSTPGSGEAIITAPNSGGECCCRSSSGIARWTSPSFPALMLVALEMP